MKNKSNATYLFKGIPLILFGLAIMFFPENVLNIISIIAGALICAAGLFIFLGSLIIKSDRGAATAIKITVALITLAFGILLIIFKASFIKTAVIILLIWSALEFLLNSFSIKDKSLTDPGVKTAIKIIIAVLLFTLAVIIIICPPFITGIISYFLGGALILNGILDIIMKV